MGGWFSRSQREETKGQLLLLPSSVRCDPCERLAGGKLEFGDSAAEEEEEEEKEGDEVILDDAPAAAAPESEEFPPWFNLELARRGQEVARGKLYGFFFGHLIALFFLLCQKDSRQILYYTQKSNTREKAFKRYLATSLQVHLWYSSPLSSDPTCPFFQSLSRVRAIHLVMGRGVQESKPDFSKPLIVEEEEEEVEVSNGPSEDRAGLLLKSKSSALLWEAFVLDLKNSKLAETVPSPILSQSPDLYYFSQFDMTLTQWSFVAIPILFQQQLGLYSISDEEFEAFIHLWAIIGHSLGLKPQYNICLVPDFQTFKVYAAFIYEQHFRPGFFSLNYESQVMCVALAEGMSDIFPFLTLEGFLLQLSEDYLGVPCPKLRSRISWTAAWRRLWARMVVKPLLRFGWFQRRVNAFVELVLTKTGTKVMAVDCSVPDDVSRKVFY